MGAQGTAAYPCWRSPALFLRLGRKREGIPLAAARFRGACGFGLCNVSGVDGNNAGTSPMRGHHHSIGLLLAHAEFSLAQGKSLGRPTFSATTEAAIRKALKKGDTGIRKIATTLGVGTGTVQRIKAEMAPPA
jgi:hypothetical protein